MKYLILGLFSVNLCFGYACQKEAEIDKRLTQRFMNDQTIKNGLAAESALQDLNSCRRRSQNRGSLAQPKK